MVPRRGEAGVSRLRPTLGAFVSLSGAGRSRFPSAEDGRTQPRWSAVRLRCWTVHAVSMPLSVIAHPIVRPAMDDLRFRCQPSQASSFGDEAWMRVCRIQPLQHPSRPRVSSPKAMAMGGCTRRRETLLASHRTVLLPGRPPAEFCSTAITRYHPAWGPTRLFSAVAPSLSRPMKPLRDRRWFFFLALAPGSSATRQVRPESFCIALAPHQDETSAAGSESEGREETWH
ncbi:hypothetical protein B0T11DRAFT_108928 [Plectosphaerella cucumerina]|uniref:Uncharacterized protein n=1 Tax=Plectosphaerella cucumerina TaxID=40658 RepID=A0A8K0TC18_9PEZI|nr:hypothetical protein B0T11DRAFT_108928 [Plectosphaerella cucumerina]